VLVTSHTGLKGSWLCAWLADLGAWVAGFSLDVPTVPSNSETLGLKERLRHFQGDVRDRGALSRGLESFEPEMVFHLAVQSLVRCVYQEPVLTIETNPLGTMNAFDCLRPPSPVKVGVIITSDKCYRNREWTWGYRENDVLGGDEPYGASKAAEMVFQAYARSYFREGQAATLATTRAGNVIGSGDWAPDESYLIVCGPSRKAGRPGCASPGLPGPGSMSWSRSAVICS
jgi:CDP-glucose 4,6-dehydratase